MRVSDLEFRNVRGVVERILFDLCQSAAYDHLLERGATEECVLANAFDGRQVEHREAVVVARSKGFFADFLYIRHLYRLNTFAFLKGFFANLLYLVEVDRGDLVV